MYRFVWNKKKKEAWLHRHLLLGVEQKWGEVEQKQKRKGTIGPVNKKKMAAN